MIYSNSVSGEFISRPNRFIAHVRLGDEVVIAHVKNTGRCRELLVPQARVHLWESANPKRSTKYDLIAVEKEGRLINMDSQAPNKVFEEWVYSSGYFGNIDIFKGEFTYGNSRFDFYMETGGRRLLIEVKGVTLEENRVVLFPDAPTERGVKHIKGLEAAIGQGFECYVVFIVQMKDVDYFTPNNRTQPLFGEVLKQAQFAGVRLIALDCDITPNSIVAKDFVEIRL